MHHTRRLRTVNGLSAQCHRGARTLCPVPQMDVSLADAPAQPPVEECPVLRALGAFDRPLLSQGAEGVRPRSAATVPVLCTT